MIRLQKIGIMKAYFDPAGQPGLELGPHVNPLFRKSEGYNVAYLETSTGDELRAAMKLQKRDPDLVEDIDFVLKRGNTLSENVADNTYAWVVSSHVVEHIPDFAGHLCEVSSVLREDGIYALLVPDRNYCFDVLKPPTTLGAVIEAFVEKRSLASIARLVDEWRYAARPEGVKIGGWSETESAKKLVSKYPNWQTLMRGLIESKGAEAKRWFGHQWYFDPVNFSSIVADLIDLGVIDLELVHVQPTYDMDFIAVLRKTSSAKSAEARKFAAEMEASYRRPPARPAVP